MLSKNSEICISENPTDLQSDNLLTAGIVPRLLQANSEGTDQAVQMLRLTIFFAMYICPKEYFLTLQPPKCHLTDVRPNKKI